MEVDVLLKTVGDLINKKITNPNYGGCCIIAATVAEELVNLGVKAEVATVADKVDNDAKNLRRKGKSFTALNTDHCVVRFKHNKKVYTWDSEGLRTDRTMPAFHKYKATKFGNGLTPKEAKELYEIERWNSDFDRKQIPKMQKLVKTTFKKAK